LDLNNSSVEYLCFDQCFSLWNALGIRSSWNKQPSTPPQVGMAIYFCNSYFDWLINKKKNGKKIWNFGSSPK
jgi:hypothetical protein